MSLPDWDMPLLEELITARGEEVIIETGMACTCRNGDHYASMIERDGKPASQRILGCPKCHGLGVAYRDGRIVRGLVTSLDPGRNKQLFESGYAIPGDAVFSPSMNASRLADFDRITAVFPEPVGDGQVIMRGAASLEENATLVTDLADNEDRLWYEAAEAIWCEDSNGVLYEQGVDYVFEAKRLIWIGNRPDKGVLYTVKYTAYLEWIVYATPFSRIDTNRDLGQRVLIRKKHVAMVNEDPGSTAASRKEAEARFTTNVKI